MRRILFPIPHMAELIKSTLILSFLALVSAGQHPGDLDPTFGENGRIYPATGTKINEAARSIVLQPDGKFVVVGEGSDSVSGLRLFLARYFPNGQPDPTFGDWGKVRTLLAPAWSEDQSIALQKDGKFLVLGYDCSSVGCSNTAAVERYLPNGQLDPSFNGNGRLRMPNIYIPGGIVVQIDGKIIIVGAGCFVVVRLNGDGTIDNTFGTNGLVSTCFENSDFASAEKIGVQLDGKIVAGGTIYYNDGWDTGLGLARYNADGSLDTSFGSSGKVTILEQIFLTDIIPQPDRKLLVGTVGLIMRFGPDGLLDSSFGDGGRVYPAVHNWRTAIQSNGKIIIGGSRYGVVPEDYNHAVARLLTNGSPDSTFGTDGVVIADFPNIFPLPTEAYIYGGVRAIAIQPDGKIISAGYREACIASCQDGPLWSYAAIARYQNDDAAAGGALYDFDGDGRTDVSVNRPSDGNWYVLNSGASPAYSVTNWGNSTDVPTPADYDDDGKTDIAVYRPATGEWFVVNSKDSSFTISTWGTAGDKPVPRDFDGDGKADISVYRPSNGTWYVFRSNNTGWDIVQWGAADDIPVPGRYDPDNKADFAVYRPSSGQWFVLPSAGSGWYSVSWGIPGDKPVTADYDGNDNDDIAVYRPSDGNWYIYRSNGTGYDVINWGNSTDTPVLGDYDGDGRADIAQYRSSTGQWFILKSGGGYDVINWGGAVGDKPLPASYIP